MTEVGSMQDKVRAIGGLKTALSPFKPVALTGPMDEYVISVPLPLLRVLISSSEKK
jgi:hypothetical protein